MKFQNYPLLFSSWLVVGCAAYQLPPLPASHPANLEAMASPESPVSRTLAYTQADIPSPRPVTATAAGQEERREVQTAAATQQKVEGEGKVVATVPSSGQLVVEHGEIKGFMAAMTMGYRVEPASLMDGLTAGDKIRFTIDVPSNAIVKIEKTK